jgi:hypothetical protein
MLGILIVGCNMNMKKVSRRSSGVVVLAKESYIT